MANEELDTAALISICQRGIVPVSQWLNRDTPDAQRQLAYAGALLQAGCGWRFARDMRGDVRTVWIRITHPTFSTFEESDPGEDELFYLPSEKRLAESAGSDWY